MAIVQIKDKVNPKDLNEARKDYGDFVKVTIDIKTGSVIIGGQWHADAEKALLESGSRQDNIWGGSIDLASQKIETIALINIRPRLGNDSQEILDQSVKEKFVEIAKRKFGI